LDKLSFTKQILGAKIHKKYCHVDILKGVIPTKKLWLSTN
jgi:hypothetical protein